MYRNSGVMMFVHESPTRNTACVPSGVTGVEFVHMFSSFGAKVTLVVSRQQVLPGKDPEVAAVLEDDFVKRGVRLVMGARAEAIDRAVDEEHGDHVVVRCDDGRVVRSSHAVLAIGSVPSSASRLATAGSCTAWTIAACSRSTIARGVPRGATMPCHCVTT